MDRGARRATVRVVQRVEHNLATKQQQHFRLLSCPQPLPTGRGFNIHVYVPTSGIGFMSKWTE